MIRSVRSVGWVEPLRNPSRAAQRSGDRPTMGIAALTHPTDWMKCMAERKARYEAIWSGGKP
jgi:hypothetical protein